MTTPDNSLDGQLALRLLQLTKLGYFITFGHRKGIKNGVGEDKDKISIADGEIDDYYMLTVREQGQDYKRTEIPRTEVAEHYSKGTLAALLLSKLEKLK